MPAETLRCPSCGAAVSSEATRCDFCKATLATVTCPQCFGMMFAGAKYCSHCGAKGSRSAAAESVARLCPRCQVALSNVRVGTTDLLECSRCQGIWVDVETLQQICADREKQAFAASVSSPLNQPLEIEKAVRYVPCPVCGELMNRVQFAHISHIIVDVCKPHGTWFDKFELERAVQFIRAGGLDKARTIQLEQIRDEQRRLDYKRLLDTPSEQQPEGHSRSYGFDGASSAVSLLFDLLS
jgi:Zn-finger nucleic acid-binding protein